MRLIFASFLLLLLTACGSSGPGKLAADVCVAEVNQRLTGKTFDLDSGDFVASAKQEVEGGDIWQLSTQIVYDRGLSTEYMQKLNCRARVDNGSASVLALEFIWAIKDLKLDDTPGK